MGRLRVMVLSHGHPDLIAGGGERAAYSLFQRLKRHPGVERALFVSAASADVIGHDAPFGAFRGREDEILACPPPVDGFTNQTLGLDQLARLVRELVSSFRPDVVHIHHFIGWGLDVLELFKKAGVRVVFTFHEFGAICFHYGQMIKVDGRLCDVSSPGECGLCFPNYGAGKFFVRETIIRHLLQFADHFVAPSEFLAERLHAWGIPHARLSVIENVLDRGVLDQARNNQVHNEDELSKSDSRVVIGFFGQITPFKGVDILLEAVRLLPPAARAKLALRIHGENRFYRDTEFDRRVQGLAADVGDAVSFRGEYRNADIIALMRACDWVIVPSIWWENSPVVMQEAMLAGRPLIAADIGGMAEKIRQQVDLLFTARNPSALADVMQNIAFGGVSPDERRLHAMALTRMAADEMHLEQHAIIYQQMLQDPRAVD